MANIKNTKEVIALLASLANAINTANDDGTVNANDLALLVSVFPTVIPAIDGISEVPAEIKDVDADELIEIGEVIADVIGDIAGDRYEYVGEQLFIAGVALTKAVKAIKDDKFESEVTTGVVA